MTHADEPSKPRRRKAAAPRSDSAGSPLVTSLGEAIERERTALMQIQAMLRCLYEVLLYADDDDSVMHADVAHVCARLLVESIERLEALRVRTGPLGEDEESPTLPPSPTYQVRDMSPAYIC